MTRLIFLILFFLISLLSIFKAPAYYIWLLAIGVTEYPLVFVAITLLLTAWGYWVVPYRTAGNWFGIIAILLFISPIIRAEFVGANVREEMAKEFSGNGRPPIFPGRSVFSFGALFNTVPEVDYKTFTYIKYADTSLTLDYYLNKLPTGRGSDFVPSPETPPVPARPCVIVVHGGSWATGDSQQLSDLNGYLANKGYNVASINYRMAPKYQTPAPVEDITQAMAYLTKHATELHIDTNNFVLLGRSAGAQIALLAAYTLHDKRIKGVIDFYGPVDMVWGYSIRANPLIMDSRNVMESYIGGTFKQVPKKYFACSPYEFADDKAIPTLMIHGTNDVLVTYKHAEKLTAKLQQHNIRHYWLKLPWATHGFDVNLNGPGGQISTFAVETFLNTITQAP